MCKVINKSGNYIVGFAKHGDTITDIKCKNDPRRACVFSDEAAQKLVAQYPDKYKIQKENDSQI